MRFLDFFRKVHTFALSILFLLAVQFLLASCALFNQPPVAVSRITPVRGEAPLIVGCDASGSYDPFGSDIISYRWTSGHGETRNSRSCSFTYTLPGDYTIRLTVEDGYGASSSTDKQVVVLAPPPPPSPSLPDVPFAIDGNGFWDFIWHCQRSWNYEADREGELVQSPGVSYARMAGDCDDFAVMVAGYAQAYWPYNSFVGWLTETGGAHAVAFVRVASYATIEAYYTDCGGSKPYWIMDGCDWLPIDMVRCISWDWDKYSMYKHSEWTEWVGKPRSLPRSLLGDDLGLEESRSTHVNLPLCRRESLSILISSLDQFSG